MKILLMLLKELVLQSVINWVSNSIDPHEALHWLMEILTWFIS